jgi:aldehyde dehydrogenase (NAD+)
VTDLSIDANWDELYVDGEWRPSESGETIAVENPSTRETATEVPSGTEADVDAAYEVDTEAQEAWGEQPPARRQAVIEEFHEALDAHVDEVIEFLEHEVGGSAIMGETSIQIAADHAGEAATLPRWTKGGEYAASNIRGKET